MGMGNEIQCHGCGRLEDVPESWVGGPHLLRCRSLDCAFVHIVWLLSNGGAVERVDPVTRFKLPRLVGVSSKVARDIEEGIRAANAGCPRASVVMLRRAIEQICLELGAKKKDRLVDKIEKLKTMGLISVVIASTAHAIRAFGNDYGAHPDDDYLDETPDDELQAAIVLTAALAEGLAKRNAE
jgi:Domain of unknown function (DUF4145)